MSIIPESQKKLIEDTVIGEIDKIKNSIFTGGINAIEVDILKIGENKQEKIKYLLNASEKLRTPLKPKWTLFDQAELRSKISRILDSLYKTANNEESRELNRLYEFKGFCNEVVKFIQDYNDVLLGIDASWVEDYAKDKKKAYEDTIKSLDILAKDFHNEAEQLLNQCSDNSYYEFLEEEDDEIIKSVHLGIQTLIGILKSKQQKMEVLSHGFFKNEAIDYSIIETRYHDAENDENKMLKEKCINKLELMAIAQRKGDAELDGFIQKRIQVLAGDSVTKDSTGYTGSRILKLNKKYSDKEGKLFHLLMDKGFIIGGKEEDISGLWGGECKGKIIWRKDGKRNEVVFLIVLLYVFMFDDFTKFNNNNIDKELINEILANKIDFSDSKILKPGTITNWSSTFKSYIRGKSRDFGKGAEDLPKQRNELIEIVKKAFSVKFDIPFEVK
jgi:hypothetical protein